MAFEGLSEKLQGVFKKLKGKGVITEADVNDAMREVKMALLEADVNFKIVKQFVASVKVSGRRCSSESHTRTAGRKNRKRGADRCHGRHKQQTHLFAEGIYRASSGRSAGYR